MEQGKQKILKFNMDMLICNNCDGVYPDSSDKGCLFLVDGVHYRATEQI